MWVLAGSPRIGRMREHAALEGMVKGVNLAHLAHLVVHPGSS